jgi:hypothetical protein
MAEVTRHGFVVLVDSETPDEFFNLEVGEEVYGGGFLAAGRVRIHNGSDFITFRISDIGEVLWTGYYGDSPNQYYHAIIELKK